MEKVKIESVEAQEGQKVYEAPRIDAILTQDELEREVLYAGAIIISPGGGGGVPS